jgi:type I restriction enzyme S subunit
MAGESPISNVAGWPEVSLSDITTKIGSGATPRGGSETYLATRTEYALVRSQNVFDRRFDSDGLVYISNEQAAGLRGASLQQDDVLLNITGDGITFGRACIVPEDIRPACVNQHVSIIRADRRKVDPGYILAFLTHPDVKPYIESFNAGGSRRAITKGHIESFRLPLPPLDQQHTVARILGALDDKIELNRKMNATLEAMARALFESWFVDFDPVRAKAQGRAPSGMDTETAELFPSKFVDSELGPIPEGWRSATLIELTTKIGSGATPRGGDKAYVDEGTALIRSQNVYDSAFTWDGLVRITDEDATRLAGVSVREEDVLLNITGASFLRTCVVERSVLPARVNQHVSIVRSRPGIPSRYLHNHLLLPTTKGFLSGLDAGASRQAVTKGHIESVPIVEPPLGVLAAWQQRVGPMYDRMSAADCESRALAGLRDGLLPRLLSGELLSAVQLTRNAEHLP